MYVIRREKWGFIGWSREYEGSYLGNDLPLKMYLGERQLMLSKISIAPKPVPTNFNSLTNPIIIGWQIINICNLHCQYCFAEPRFHGSIVDPSVSLQDIADRIISLRPLSIWLSGGEPFLVKGLDKLLIYLDKHSFPVSVDTNGTVVSPFLLDILAECHNHTLRISLDSYKLSSHNKLRGNGEKTIKTLHSLLNRGINTTVSTVLTRNNLQDINELYDFLIRLGVKRWFLFQLVNSGWAIRLYEDLKVDTNNILQELFYRNNQQGHPISIFHIEGGHPLSTVLVNEEGHLYTVDGPKRISVGSLLKNDPNDLWFDLPLDKKAHIKKYLNLIRDF